MPVEFFVFPMKTKNRLISLVLVIIMLSVLSGVLVTNNASAATPTPTPTVTRNISAEAYAFAQGVFYGCRNSAGGFTVPYCVEVMNKAIRTHAYIKNIR